MKRILTWRQCSAIMICLAPSIMAQVRLKDIADVQGARSNKLIGYGLVMGLEGTGDSNSAVFTTQALASALQRLGITVSAAAIKVKNVAAVTVTAELPAFAKVGGKIDVTVSSIGDAKSLQGGNLLMTQLVGPDNKVYALAQGAVSIGGFIVAAEGSSNQKNHVNVGRVPGGASVEREVPTSLTDGETVDITLHKADFTTANRVADAMNAKTPDVSARAIDPYTIRLKIPSADKGELVRFISKVENILVMPDARSVILVNERTGTVVISGEVRVMPCAIAHSDIQVIIENNPIITPATPFSKSITDVVPRKDIKVKVVPNSLAVLQSNKTVEDLVKALNKLGVNPRDLIHILQALQQAGALSAEIVIQ